MPRSRLGSASFTHSLPHGSGTQLRRSSTVLIVDDFEGWRDQVRSLLQQRPDWQVIAEACDGLEAVQYATELKPDVIILDIAMPSLNGVEAAAEIKIHSPQSRVVFLSEFADIEIKDAALRTGAQAYVTKSNAASELINAISAALRPIH